MIPSITHLSFSRKYLCDGRGEDVTLLAEALCVRLLTHTDLECKFLTRENKKLILLHELLGKIITTYLLTALDNYT